MSDIPRNYKVHNEQIENYDSFYEDFKRDLAYTDHTTISRIADKVLEERNIDASDK
jgi:hypothetical protein